MVKLKYDLQTQNLFRRATARGMVVNSAETKVLCISDAQSYSAAAKFEDGDGNSIESGGHLKILGFHMDSRPSCHAHMEALLVRIRETVWVLRHLGRVGFNESELAKVYTTVIQPRTRRGWIGFTIPRYFTCVGA